MVTRLGKLIYVVYGTVLVLTYVLVALAIGWDLVRTAVPVVVPLQAPWHYHGTPAATVLEDARRSDEPTGPIPVPN
jgi:hypothetical protein